MAVELRKLLAKLLKKAPDNIRFSKERRGGRKELLRAVREFQLGDLIVKRLDSVYEAAGLVPGLKVKLTRQHEFVIRGYAPPEGSRKYFGALLVGYYDSSRLLFAGRVDTGFSEKALATSGVQFCRKAPRWEAITMRVRQPCPYARRSFRESKARCCQLRSN